MPRLLRHALWLVVLVALPALADTRVTLSRDAVAFGESVTLTIDTDQPVASPDLRPLRADFDVGNVDNARQFSIDGGSVRATQSIRVVLRPRRVGMLTVPPLVIGNQRTSPLVLEVSASGTAPSPAPASSSAANQSRGPVFIDTVLDDTTPYVQQAVGVTVRLHYALNLYNGTFNQPEPAQGGSLQPIGNDTRSVRVVDGREYQVLERHYLLVPERSGVLRLPGATFRGEGQGGFFDSLFGDGRDSVGAEAPARTLQVKPIPAGAGQPWLPVRALDVRVASPPTQARAGEAFDIVVELRVDGATAAQLPELQLEGADAQVFAEPAQPTEGFADGRPTVVLTRRFSVVPQHPGPLQLQLAPIAWWDVATGTAREARLAPINVQVAPGSGRYARSTPPGDAVDATTGESASNVLSRLRDAKAWPWWLAGAAVLLAGIVLIWRRRARVAASVQGGAMPSRPAQANGANTHTATHPSTEAASPIPRTKPDDHRRDTADFHRALGSGDLSAVARLLPRLATPPLASLAEARAQLDDPAQRDAVAQLERALWANGDVEAARARLRQAFARDPRWRRTPKTAKALLPPLYPEG